MNIRQLFAFTAIALSAGAPPALCGGTLPRPDHVVVVIMENHSYNRIIGNPAAPHINALAAEGALFVPAATDPEATRSGSHALRHPSQPNYLELYSGNNQGVVGNGYPGSSGEPLAQTPPFNTPNLGAQLIAKGFSFATYSESLPAVGSNVQAFTYDPAVKQYERKHNPAVNWQSADAPANQHLRPALNQPFFPLPGKPGTGFPADPSKLPTVSFVVPNQQNDMHDGSVARADTWLKKNIVDTYFAWAKTHNSLLILTFDEDGDDTPSNLITTIFAGPMIKPGQYTELDINAAKPDVRPEDGFVTPTGTALNHYNVLATIEDFYGLPHIGGAVGRPAVSDIFLSSLVNISTRALTGGGNNVTIGGFILRGQGKKKVVLRGIGPSINLDGTLRDPVIELYQSSGSVLAANDDWKDTQQAEIRQSGLAPTNDRESAISISLDPGSYTLILSGKNGASGIGLVEAYDVEKAAAPKLLNLSTRGNVQTGNGVMIGGIIIDGGDYARVIFRGIGPSLNVNGVPLSGRLNNPTLDLRDANGAPVAFNDNWKEMQQAEIQASGLAPEDDRESAIIGTYAPGSYTVIMRGKDETSGIGLVETYKLN